MTDSIQKIILVTQRTRLEDLIRRYNTFGQAEFIISHNGGDFSDYRLEYETYHCAVQTVLSALQAFGRVQVPIIKVCGLGPTKKRRKHG